MSDKGASFDLWAPHGLYPFGSIINEGYAGGRYRGGDKERCPDTRKPALGGLLEVLLRLSGTGLDSYLVPGSFELKAECPVDIEL